MPHRLRVGTIGIVVHDPERMARFWEDALGYDRWPADGEDSPFVVLRDRHDGGPSITLDPMVPEKGRIRLDLHTNDLDREIERLRALGAHEHRPRAAGEDWAVLEDPEGNIFYVVTAGPSRRPARARSRPRRRG
jgi:predicted enzyme related to lactoylglutathione lyase